MIKKMIKIELPLIIGAIRKDRQERLDWIYERFVEAGLARDNIGEKSVLPTGPLSVTMRFEYPPVKGISKKTLAVMQVGQDVPRVVHPTVTALADLLIEEMLPFNPARVSKLVVEKVTVIKSPKVMIMVEAI